MKKIPSVESLRAARPEAASAEAAPKSVGDVASSPASDVTGDGADDAASEADGPSNLKAAGAVAGASVRKRKAGPSPSKQRQRLRYARERTVQALYQWDVGNSSSSEVLRYFIDQQDMSRADPDYFRAAFQGVTHDPVPLDGLISPLLDRGFDELDPVERAILRLAAWELSQQLATPVRVVINEAVEVAKRFGAEQGYRFINGVLDALGRQLRPHEQPDERPQEPAGPTESKERD